jgi:hypothetical protein
MNTFIQCYANREYHVVVTSTQLCIGYSAGCMQVTVDRSRILTVESIPKIQPWCDWGGYGIRKQLPSWETGYIAAAGPGVRMTMRDDKGHEKAYTFTCQDAEKVVTLLTS